MFTQSQPLPLPLTTPQTNPECAPRYPEIIIHFCYQLAKSARNGTEIKMNQVLQVRHAFPPPQKRL